MTTSRALETPASPLLNVINSMGEDCKLSESEIYKKLDDVYAKFPEIKDQGQLLQAAIVNGNRWCLSWLLDDLKHPSFRVGLAAKDLKKMVEYAVAYEDKGEETQSIRIQNKRAIIDFFIRFYFSHIEHRLASFWVDHFQKVSSDWCIFPHFYMAAMHHNNQYFLKSFLKADNQPKVYLHIIDEFMRAMKKNPFYYKFLNVILDNSEFIEALRTTEVFNYWNKTLSKVLEASHFELALKLINIGMTTHANQLDYVIRVFNDGFITEELAKQFITALGSKQHVVAREYFYLAMESKNISIVKLLIGFCNARKYIDDACLTKACEINDTIILRYIISQLIDKQRYINKQNGFGWATSSCPALYQAVELGHIEAVKILLENGASYSQPAFHKASEELKDPFKAKNKERSLNYLKAIFDVRAGRYQQAAITCQDMDPLDKQDLACLLMKKIDFTKLEIVIPDKNIIKKAAMPAVDLLEQKELVNVARVEPSAPLLEETKSTVSMLFKSLSSEQEGEQQMKVSLSVKDAAEAQPGLPLFQESADEIDLENQLQFAKTQLSAAKNSDFWKENPALQQQFKFYCCEKIQALQNKISEFSVEGETKICVSKNI